MKAGFELFDHTADVGVRAFAPSLSELVRVAGEGLYSVIGELRPQGEPRPERFEFTDGDLSTLLHDHLSELLLIFERDHRMVTDLTVETFEPGCLRASGQSYTVDRDASLLDREVKAVTYHGLEINRIDDGYETRYIVDI
ncbi:MAG TPA: archease [Phycisphaerae bacterium]|nr:archease [Phycisphaerae bacterium]HOJ73039.1 archease [Phycisphaerae bacterium]HOM52656.1 archease [Phycisphaerae bacterium]HON68319.1 archease [Phycisphaerae bacterium]HOQ87798.1 archease [Phycisphaerae bacterium]